MTHFQTQSARKPLKNNERLRIRSALLYPAKLHGRVLLSLFHGLRFVFQGVRCSVSEHRRTPVIVALSCTKQGTILPQGAFYQSPGLSFRKAWPSWAINPLSVSFKRVTPHPSEVGSPKNTDYQLNEGSPTLQIPGVYMLRGSGSVLADPPIGGGA